MKLKMKCTLVFCILYSSIWIFFQLIQNKILIHHLIHPTEMTQVTVQTEDTMITLPLEEYLIGVVASEMPANFEMEALKAQAVASRSFVISRNFQVDDTTASQVYKTKETLKNQWKDDYDKNYTKIRQAVYDTQNEVLIFNNEVISATFFSSSNGKTNNSEDYWISQVDYLVSVDSPWDTTEKLDQIRIVNFTWEQVEAIFGQGKDYTIQEHYDNGYVKSVNINQKQYTGRQVRELLNLSSSCFEWFLDDTGITITTVGSGHGVGMSQYGANGMAKEGYTYQNILKHYYQGVEISKYE